MFYVCYRHALQTKDEHVQIPAVDEDSAHRMASRIAEHDPWAIAWVSEQEE